MLSMKVCFVAFLRLFLYKDRQKQKISQLLDHLILFIFNTSNLDANADDTQVSPIIPFVSYHPISEAPSILSASS